MQLGIGHVIESHTRRVSGKASEPVNPVAERLGSLDISRPSIGISDIALDQMDRCLVSGFHSLFQDFGPRTIVPIAGHYRGSIACEQGNGCTAQPTGSTGDEN